ncbi:hypothetical protein [Bacillus taeanensis]|uniref:Uncharacterized protein n=1 Tax=Bacillus taeanensis TaxID=273032 RepID=A0A366XS38_9BACI|nr:hypothetical protein [Bacillus taeanensis]RBW68707.1 hypothetical protein DS031_15240 [Bacillus taeanensis]
MASYYFNFDRYFFPRILWEFREERPLNIAVLDKTVPKEDYREHLGLFWLLTHEKIATPDYNLYELEEDYYGYDPYESKGDTEMELLPNLDMIYIADTYGVYTDDLRELPEGERSELLYGALELKELDQLLLAKEEHTTLIAEFNTFASPTSGIARKGAEKTFHLDWSGWIGRYFPDLNSSEVPPWLIRNYEAQTGEKWRFKEGGLAFVHESDRVIVFDREGYEEKVTFQWTDLGKRHYPNGKNTEYRYWFDIVVPEKDTTIEAVYELSLRESEKEILQKEGIPLTFPAVIHHPQHHTYYFAGDYADTVKVGFEK